MRVYFSSHPQLPVVYMFVPLASGAYFGPLSLKKTSECLKVDATFAEAVAEQQIPVNAAFAPVLRSAEVEGGSYFGADEDSFGSIFTTKEFGAFALGFYRLVVERDIIYRAYEKHRRN